MPLDAAEIDDILRKRGLLKDEPGKGGPPPTPVAPPVAPATEPTTATPPAPAASSTEPTVTVTDTPLVTAPPSVITGKELPIAIGAADVGKPAVASAGSPGAPTATELRPVVVWGEGPEGKRYALTQAEADKYYAANTPAEKKRVLEGLSEAATTTVAAPAAPAAAPAVAPTAATPGAPPTELSATVARARDVIGGMESSDRYDIVHPPAKNGQVALGRYGILASGLADDSQKYYGRVVSQQEFLKNPDIQDKIFDGRFGALVQKYGVEGASRAWFAGEDGMNNDSASDGNTTVRNYASQFMQRFNGGEATATPVRASGGRMSPEQIRTMLDARGISTAPQPDKTSSFIESLSPSSLFETAKTAAQDWATTYSQYEAGVLKGIAHTTLAPVQAVSEMTGDWYKPVEQRVSDLEDALDSKVGGKGTWADLTGRVMGTIGTIVVGSRALGPVGAVIGARLVPQIAQSAWKMIGPVGRSMATVGAGGAATTYYPEGSVNEHRLGLERLLPVRAIDGAMFTMLGGIGGVVTRGATWIANKLAETSSAARTAAHDAASEAADAAYVARAGQAQTLFNGVLQQTANNMTKNSEGPLRNVIEHYGNVERLGQQKYAIRNSAGQQFEGFKSGVGTASGLKQALGEGAEATAEAGVRQSSKAGTARQAARTELGLPEEEARYRAWQTQQQEYERRSLEWQTAMEGHQFAGPQYLRQAEQAGQIPPRPQPPPAFVPEPVTAAQFSAARTALNDAWRRAKGDAAAQTQIKQMIGGIDSVAEREASAYGLPIQEFMRKAAAANKFYEENVAPLRYGLFKGRTSAQLEGRPGVPYSGMTPTEFHELVMKPVRDNNLKRVEDLVKVLGPKSKSDIASMAASEAILLSDKPAREWVKSRKEVLTTLLGASEYAQLEGLAAIAEHIQAYKPFVAPKPGATEPANNFVDNLLKGNSVSTLGRAAGFYQLGRAVLGIGNVQAHLRDAALYFFGPPLANLAFNVVTNLHKIPALRPLVKGAGHLEPGSPQLDKYLLQLERRMRGRVSTTVRGASEAVDSQQ